MTKRLRYAGTRVWNSGLALLLLCLAACTEATGIGDDLPSPNIATGTFYTDTLTVRTSTVLTDSVVSSGTGYLLTGRYVDARLGTIVARGFLQPGLSSAFQPTQTMVYDSLVLELTADSYRYGDTTRTQQLAVHRLQEPFRTGKTYYTRDALGYEATALGSRTFRARAGLGSFRMRLADGLGRELLQAGQSGQLMTTDELRARLPGLALAPGGADNASLRWAAAATLHLYYHDPTDPTVAITEDFSAAGSNAYFFQLQADRSSTALASLTGTRQALASAATAEETYIQAGLGLRTKLEFPYLQQLKDLGGTIIVNSAQLRLEVVTSTESRFLPPPATLVPRLTSRANQSGALFLNADGSTLTVAYQQDISARTGLQQGFYALNLTAYMESVLRGTLENNGILLSAEASTVERVILGSTANTAHPLQLKVYYSRIAP
ncbi:DUF4270 family protein [Hymenobacter sediminicola]|uniref:DUF4270 family protein n=1 Tax=Hymenobacter sediminicola TaxID=2761579 RepID=A0A7G7W3N9_9BACT|nr:DUF4270 family protein [Hymenobacter sediminicola]QNH60982.1 DUF4270 family protein [Hymenobacter sediminicola]